MTKSSKPRERSAQTPEIIRRDFGTVKHSAYWYAKKYGIHHSDKTTCTGRYLDFIPVYRAFGDSVERRVGRGSFDPMTFAFYAAMDLGTLMAREMKRLVDPVQRRKRKEQIQMELRRIQRPIYYAREKKRRQELAIERRKIRRRSTTAPMPTPEDVRTAWAARKQSKERMILLGGMLHDLECYVDRRLFFDDAGNIVRRAGGIRGWLRENLPELSPHYKTLMRYKAMAVKLRQATGLHDPVPTSALLEGISTNSTENENLDRKTLENVAEKRNFAADVENENLCRKEIGEGAKSAEKVVERGREGVGTAPARRGGLIEKHGEVIGRREMVATRHGDVLERRGAVMKAILAGRKNTFAAIVRVLEDELSPERVCC